MMENDKRNCVIDFTRVKGFQWTILVLSLFLFLFLSGIILLSVYLGLGSFPGKAFVGGFGYVLSIIFGILFAVLLFLFLRKALWIKKHLIRLSEESFLVDIYPKEDSFQEEKGIKSNLFSFDGPIDGGEDFFLADVELEGRKTSLRVLFFSPLPFLPLPILKEGRIEVLLAHFDDERTFLLALKEEK